MVCPKAKNEKALEAEKMFLDGMPMVDIAKKLGVSDGTVRSWKNRYGWGKSVKKKMQRCKREERKREERKRNVAEEKSGSPIWKSEFKGT